MAGNSSRFVCKSNLESCENAVSLWSAQNINPSSRSNAFNSDELRRCHQDCFVCAVCNSSPEDKAQAYSVSRHHCGQNVESDTLIQALNDFKARSLASKAALENTESSKNFLKSTVGISELKCSCDEPQHIERVAGYGVECTEKNCPKREFIANIYNHHTKSFSDFGSLNSGTQLSSVAPEKFYREFFHGLRHWTYCANEDDVGVLLFILKPESSPQSRGCYRIMVRSAYYLIFGLLSLSNQQDNVPSKEEVVQFLRRQVNVKSSMTAISTPLAKTDLLKMDSAFVKQAYKFGVIYMKENQQTEEELFGNETHSKAFDDFLDLLGQRIRLRGFDKYRAGLDNNNDLTGTHSVYTKFADNEIMFHVSTLLPFEEFDSQKLQRKRHIGNDIVCIVFMEARNTKFIPDCIKSNFLHSFIVVQVDVERNPHLYMVSLVSRADVQPFDPPLHEKHVFEKNDEFRDWILKKLIHAEQACHRVPSFAKLHAKTRELILGGLFKSVDIKSRSEENRNSCPNSSVVHDHQCHITAGQVTRDFSCMNSEGHNREDTVAFLVGDINKKCFIGVKSVMMSKSKVFHKIFTQAIPSANSNAPVIKTSPSSASPILKRTVSWRPGQLVHTGLRSGKVNLEKMRRCKSLNEAEDPYVTLESFTDFENKTDSENPAVMSHLLWQKVLIVKLFQSDVFEVLLEYLHTGSCEPVPSLLPGLLSAAQYYEVEELQQLCVGKIKQVNNVP